MFFVWYGYFERANESKNRTIVYRDSKGIKTSGIISSNSEKSIRIGKYFINYYGGASRYGNNKEKTHREIKKKSVSPKRLDRKSATSSSFYMDTSSSENDELELRNNKSKNRTKVDRHNEGIGTARSLVVILRKL